MEERLFGQSRRNVLLVYLYFKLYKNRDHFTQNDLEGDLDFSHRQATILIKRLKKLGVVKEEARVIDSRPKKIYVIQEDIIKRLFS